MKIKNLAIATILTLTTATAILTINNKDVIQTKAESNNIIFTEKTKPIANQDETVYIYSSKGQIHLDNNTSWINVDQYYISVREDNPAGDYDHKIYTMTTIEILHKFADNGITISPNYKLTPGATPAENKTNYRTINETEITNIKNTLKNAQSWFDYLSISTYQTEQNIYNWQPQNTLKTPKNNNEMFTEYYVYITTWGHHNSIYTQDFPAWIPYTYYSYTGYAEINIEVPASTIEVVDVGGLMLQIISMPFTFISTAFNLTLFPGTPYQINIGNFILGILAILTILFIIKIFTGGLDIIGNITQSAASHTKSKTKVINANNNLKAAKTNNKAVKTKAEKK